MAHNDDKGWSGKSRGGFLGYLIFVKLIRSFGVRVAYILLSFVVVYFIPFAPSATRSVWKFSRIILGKGRCASFFFIYKNFYSFGRAIIDKIAVNQGKYNQYSFDFSEPEDVKNLLNSRQGVVIIGAHFGNWEVGAPFFGKYGKKMNIVMMNREFEGIRRILELNRSLDAFNVITIEGDSLEYIFKIRDALARGEYVSLQGDRISRSEKHIQKTFMGKSASFPLGPFVIAARMNVPVVFYFAEHIGFKRYKFDFVLSSYNDVNQDKQREKFLVEEYVKVLEDRVKRYPEQWHNFYEFWDYER